MERATHVQKIIMPLTEALELGNIVIKGRGMPGRTGNQSEEYEYKFLDIPEILKQFNELPDNEYDDLGYGIEYVGYMAYLARAITNKYGSVLEVKRAGCLKDYPEFTDLILRDELPIIDTNQKRSRLSQLYNSLKKSANQYFERYPWQEKEKLELLLNDKKDLDYDETEKLLGIAGHRIRVDGYIDKNWRLAILSSCPWAKSPKIYDYPDINLGIPESVVYSGQDKPYAVLNYSGRRSLENQILRDLVQPQNLGNGVIVMNEDRSPKYLKRTLGL